MTKCANFRKAIPSKSTEGNIVTPGGRMVYASLFQKTLPRGEKDESKAKYQNTILFPAGVDVDLLTKAVDEIIAEKVSSRLRATTKVKKPFLLTKDQPRFAEFADEYPLMIRSAGTLRPDVISPSGQPVREENEPDEIYHGRWCRMSVQPFFYDHPTGGKGVSLGLQNVQLLDHDDPLEIAGSKPKGAGEFEAVTDDGLGDLA